MAKQCKFINAVYSNSPNLRLEEGLVPKLIAADISCPVSSCAQKNAGGHLSDVSSCPDGEKLLKSWGSSTQSPHVSHMKAPALLTSGKKGATEDGRGRGERFKCGFSPWTWKIMGQELCTKTLQPGGSCHRCWEGGDAHGCRRTAPVPEPAEAAIEVSVSQEHLPLLINGGLQRLPFWSRVGFFCAGSKPIKGKSY